TTAPTTTATTAPPSPLPAATRRDGLPTVEQLVRERAGDDSMQSYRIGPGDVVEVGVFELKELNRRVRVSDTGEILLPLVGAVPAAEMTEAELGDEIAARLERDYLRNPQVDVFVAEYQSALVAVTGSVEKPGLFPLTRDRNSLLDLLSEAGGPTNEAGGVLELMPARSAGAVETLARVQASGVATATPSVGGVSIDIQELMSGSNPTLLALRVMPGDVIFVPVAGAVSVEGWVEKPGSYKIDRGMTVLSAIAAGGGELFPAALSRVELYREGVGRGGGGEQIVDIDAVREGRTQDVVLQAGDIVRVLANIVKLAPYSVYWSIRNLMGLGIGTSVPLQP
ncbi:MAG: polysaccharide biosynthesis/export family protein, partial [Candidatus Binatia bacterium]